jgi:hypothetical protein
MTSPYAEDIALVEKLIIKEKVPTKNPKGLATIAVYCASYGAGDCLAGMFLDKIFADKAANENLCKFIEKATGKKHKYASWVSLSNAFEELGKKHKVFAALDYMALTGGRGDKLRELEKEEL